MKQYFFSSVSLTKGLTALRKSKRMRGHQKKSLADSSDAAPLPRRCWWETEAWEGCPLCLTQASISELLKQQQTHQTVSKRNPHILDHRAYICHVCKEKIAILLCGLEFDSGVKGLLNMTGQRTCSQNLFLAVLAVVYFLTKYECFSLNNLLYFHEEKGNHFVKSFRFGLSKNCFI